MKRRTGWRGVLIQCAALALLFVLSALSFADVLMPETGSKTKKNGGLTIDYSNMKEGYVMAKGPKGKKKLKLRMKNRATPA